ncbi:MAG: hypothetical protein VKP62_05690 [Candidatus Sericytochromatia bacterium]|nr:hypothetical protein [Candidatus Sericytochromatia bacterium]
MQPTHFRLKQGAFEVELSGSAEFVERQLSRYLASWMQAAGDPELGPEARVASTPVAPADAPQDNSSEVFPRVRPDFQPKVNVSLAEFVHMKEAVSPSDLLVVGAYYLEKYHRQESFTAADLQKSLAQLPAWDCRQVDIELESVLTMGWLERLRDGHYTLTFKGQNYVRDGLV